MNVKKVLFYLLAGILGGCGPVMSLHRLYTEKELVFEEKLLGTWIDANNESTWEFSCPEQASKKYQLVYTDDEERKGLFEVHLVKLEDEFFLDVYPSQFPCEIEDPNKTDWFYNAFFLLPVHTFVKVDSFEPNLKLKLTDNEKMEELLEDDPNAIRFESFDDRLVLTASTKELQKFVLKYADDERFFSNELVLVRKKISEPNDAGLKPGDPNQTSQTK